jgi:hypothetical protein
MYFVRLISGSSTVNAANCENRTRCLIQDTFTYAADDADAAYVSTGAT